MPKELDNVKTYFGIIFIAFLAITGIILAGNETGNNSNSNLDNDSVDYILGLQGINRSDVARNPSYQEASLLVNENFTQGNPKDYALDFQFAKEKGITFENSVKLIFSLPSTVLFDVLRLPRVSYEWIIDLLGWLLGLLVGIAVINYARKGT